MQICFATNNPHKLHEVQHLLGGAFHVVSPRDVGCFVELPEERDTLEGNSLQKAEYIFANYHIPCFADDSGLEVFSLDGAPGVDSAHYAGLQRNPEDNMDLLLKNLSNVIERNARFRAVITYMDAKGNHQFEGIVKGTIGFEKKGFGGFGYDPLFVPEGYSRTFAEMSLDEKNKFSHRAIAVKKFVEFLKSAATH